MKKTSRPLKVTAIMAASIVALAAVGPISVAPTPAQGAPTDMSTMENAHAFSFQSIDGADLPLSRFDGKVVLVVNTASFCGFTPQYKGLQALWETHRDRGFVVLGVPSNDFGQQEPGSAAEIKEFCDTSYRIDFPLTTKTVVSGPDAHPFYRWATEELGVLAKPRWNFHKYLIDRDGRLVDWFSSITDPGASRVETAIEAALAR